MDDIKLSELLYDSKISAIYLINDIIDMFFLEYIKPLGNLWTIVNLAKTHKYYYEIFKTNYDLLTEHILTLKIIHNHIRVTYYKKLINENSAIISQCIDIDEKLLKNGYFTTNYNYYVVAKCDTQYRILNSTTIYIIIEKNRYNRMFFYKLPGKRVLNSLDEGNNLIKIKQLLNSINY